VIFLTCGQARRDLSQTTILSRTAIRGHKQVHLMNACNLTLWTNSDGCVTVKLRRDGSLSNFLDTWGQPGGQGRNRWLAIRYQARPFPRSSLVPFAGPLHELSKLTSSCVLCETYPQEAYTHLGIKFPPGTGKRNQTDRLRQENS